MVGYDLFKLERELEDTSTSQSSDRNEVSENELQQASYKQLVEAKVGNFRDRIRELESICDE